MKDSVSFRALTYLLLFGLAISGGNIYGLFVSTHYPSSVTADEGGPVYYQQQVLATVSRSAYGAAY